MSNIILSPAIPQLPSGDIEKTAEFFKSVLNFHIAEKLPEFNHLIVKRGNAEIHFWQASTEAEAKSIAGQSSCYIRVDNINALFKELKARGAPFAYELTKKPGVCLKCRSMIPTVTPYDLARNLSSRST